MSGPQRIRWYFCLFLPLGTQAVVFFSQSAGQPVSQLTHVAHSMYSRLKVFLRASVLDGGALGAVGYSCVFLRDCSPGTKNQCQQLMGHLKALTPCPRSSPHNLPLYLRTNPRRDLSEQLCPECFIGWSHCSIISALCMCGSSNVFSLTLLV